MKRIVACVLIVALLLMAFPVVVSAQRTVKEIQVAIHEALLSSPASIDVTEYEINQEDLGDIVWPMLWDYGDLYFVSGFSASVSRKTGKIVSIKPTYRYDAATVAWVKGQIDAVLEGVQDDWSELEIALYCHDYLATHFQYDLRLYDSELQSAVARDVYMLFNEGVGVCEAYAETYQYLLQECGIDCRLVYSDDAGHEWNLVELGGNWYHVDVTEDDPIFGKTVAQGQVEMSVCDRAGYVAHTYFLKSDVAMYDKYRGGHHYDWIVGYGNEMLTADSSLYNQGYVFNKTFSPFVPFDGVWYYWDNTDSQTAVLRGTVDFKTDTVALLELAKKWNCADVNMYYPELCTSLAGYGDYLIYNTDHSVELLNPKDSGDTVSISTAEMVQEDPILDHTGNEPEEVYQPLYLYGFRMENNVLIGQFSNYMFDTTYYHIYHAFQVPDSCLPGDANGDGLIDTTDLVQLKKVLAGLVDENDCAAGIDANGDGAVDTADLVALKKFLAGLIDSLGS